MAPGRSTLILGCWSCPALSWRRCCSASTTSPMACAMHSIPMSAEPALSPSTSRPILSVRDMSVQFKLPQGWITAVDRVSFDLREGEIVGIVGESGSGKSQILLSLMGLLAGNGRCSGSALLEEQQLLNRPPRELDAI